MKRNRTTRRNGSGSPVRKVHVEFVHPTAAKVCIAGAFNDWRPEASAGSGQQLFARASAPAEHRNPWLHGGLNE